MERRKNCKTNVSPRFEAELVKHQSSRRALIIAIVVAALFFLSLIFVKLILPFHLRLPDFVERGLFTNESSAYSDNDDDTSNKGNILSTFDVNRYEPDLDSDHSMVTIATPDGPLRGFKVTVLSRSIGVFLGIPYAKPPVGHRRFRRPEPLKPWNYVRDATRFGPQCVQFKPNRTYTPWISSDDYMSEDCLYLNIWTPLDRNQRSSSARALKPVMVWIHGGAFFSGSADLTTYDGRILSSFGDVVIVTINYRLGAFGFLNLGTESSPGNQGLHDQVTALRWVQRNIAAFGGDPDLVTLFGQSAGAISIGLHYISPLSSDLFRRGIMQSGAPTVTRLFYEREGTYGRRGLTLASMVGCYPSSSSSATNSSNEILTTTTINPAYELQGSQGHTADDLVRCLQSVDVHRLKAAQDALIDEMSLSFGPTLGDDFLPANPISLMDLGEMGDQREILLGSTRDEGTFFLHYLDPARFGPSLSNITHAEIMAFVRQSFPFLTPRVASLVFSSFLPLSESSRPETVRQILSDFIGDSTFLCPLTLFSQLFVKNDGTAYFYVFDHKPSNSPWPNWMGVLHFDEVQFIFGVPLRTPHLYSPEEVAFSKRLMKTWVTFAKTGVPSDQLGHDWPEYTPQVPHYVSLFPGNVTIESGPKESVCARWHIMLQTS